MLGKNSLYVFYVLKDDKEVIISPIEGNIKMIKKCPIFARKQKVKSFILSAICFV